MLAPWNIKSDARSVSTLREKLKFGVDLIGSRRHVAQATAIAILVFGVEANPIIVHVKMPRLACPEE